MPKPITSLEQFYTHTQHTTVLRLCGICPGKPGWAGTIFSYWQYL